MDIDNWSRYLLRATIISLLPLSRDNALRWTFTHIFHDKIINNQTSQASQQKTNQSQLFGEASQAQALDPFVPAQ